jgi:hypothetical protein
MSNCVFFSMFSSVKFVNVRVVCIVFLEKTKYNLIRCQDVYDSGYEINRVMQWYCSNMWKLIQESDNHVSQTIIHQQTDLYTELNVTYTVYTTVKALLKAPRIPNLWQPWTHRYTFFCRCAKIWLLRNYWCRNIRAEHEFADRMSPRRSRKFKAREYFYTKAREYFYTYSMSVQPCAINRMVCFRHQYSRWYDVFLTHKHKFLFPVWLGLYCGLILQK